MLELSALTIGGQFVYGGIIAPLHRPCASAAISSASCLSSSSSTRSFFSTASCRQPQRVGKWNTTASLEYASVTLQCSDSIEPISITPVGHHQHVGRDDVVANTDARRQCLPQMHIAIQMSNLSTVGTRHLGQHEHREHRTLLLRYDVRAVIRPGNPRNLGTGQAQALHCQLATDWTTVMPWAAG